jgi:hypothetical protein
MDAPRYRNHGDSDVSKMTFRTTLAAALSCALILPAMTGTARAGFEWTPPPRTIPKAAPQNAMDDMPPVSAAPAVPVEAAPLAGTEDPVIAAARAEAAAQAAMNAGAAASSAPPADPWAEEQGQEQQAAAPLSDDPMGRIAAPGTPVPRGPSDDAPMIMPRHTAMQVPAPAPVPAPLAPVMKAAPMPVMPVMPMAAPAVPGMALAEGFGRDIPLALALPQIVPAGYSFAFGNGADAGVRVSWDGGRPWNHVLTDALAPHGMMPVIAGNTVWVRPVVAGMPAPYLPAPVPVTAMPVPVTPDAAAPAQNAANGGGWDAVNEWKDEKNYNPSYPRRDPVAARERMMQGAAVAVQGEEPSGNNPDTLSEAATYGAEAIYLEAPAAVPMPLTASEPPAAEAAPVEGKAYTQLTGLDEQMIRSLDPHEIRYWQAQPGESLRTVLTNWSEQAGVQLFWAEGHDYQIGEAIQMHGTFQNAITKILEGYTESHPQPQGQLHPNRPNGPAVLIIDHRA